VTIRLITLSLRQVLRLLLLACRSSRSKDLELLVLRQELVVMRRQVPHPRTRQEERLVLTVLQRLRPAHERLSNLFTPDRSILEKIRESPHLFVPCHSEVPGHRLAQIIALSLRVNVTKSDRLVRPKVAGYPMVNVLVDASNASSEMEPEPP
jgi:hypothetical protein